MTPLKHLYEIQQLDRETLEMLMSLAQKIQANPGYYDGRLTGRRVATVFYEPSTRTRLSFEAAALALGATCISTENARQFSSAAKGETLADTARIVSGYAHAIVLRYDHTGGAEEAARYASVPVINAGDGTGQHPTQSLLDLYTILKYFPSFEGKTIALVGDLGNGRTVHSLAYLIAKHYPRNRLILIAPNFRKVLMSQDILNYLDRKEVKWSVAHDWGDTLHGADIVYMTRVQDERFKDDEELRRQVVAAAQKLDLTPERVCEMKSEAIILHPLPRKSEIPLEIDSDPRAKYFEQAQNGLYVRMAILMWLLGAAT